jgi:hypothetical protein
LRPYLEAAWDQAEPGAVWVITKHRDTNANLRTKLCRIIAKAGLVPWEKPFQNLRATRATELVSQGWPEFKVCEWLGHTEAVARKHYWQVTDEDYRKAAGLPPSGPAAALQMALQTSGANPCNPMNGPFSAQAATPDNSPGCINSHRTAHYCTDDQVTPAGLERASHTPAGEDLLMPTQP